MLSYKELLKVKKQINKKQEVGKLFKWLADNDFTWDRLVMSLVTGMPKKDKNEYENARKDLMKKLLKKRDRFDIKLYKLAVKSVFKELFNKEIELERINKGMTTRDKKTKKHKLLMRWYIIKIYDDTSDINNDPNRPHWRVIVKAPGSRTPTSDIDTTISVCRVGALPDELNKYKDYVNLIKNSVIKHFYQISKKICGISSSLSRDSNVYHDGFMEKLSVEGRVDDEQENQDYANYGKFLGHEKFDKKNRMLRLGLRYKQLYQKQKRMKHQYEYAASLFSLRSYFGEKTKLWEKFKSLSAKEIKSLLGEGVIDKCISDFKEICRNVDDFYKEYKVSLEKEISELKKDKSKIICSDFKKSKRKMFSKIEEKDIEVLAMNKLYVEYLNEIPQLNEEINKLLSEEAKYISKIQESERILSDLNYSVKEFDEMTSEKIKRGKFKNIISDTVTKRDTAKKTHEDNLEEYKKYLLKISDLQNKKQRALIKANMFANEAYVNRSAVIHVVKGLQSHDKGQTSKQVIVCSALQQIGLKLLHAKKQRKEGLCEATIAYKNDKYLSRVNHLFFNDDKEVLNTDKLKNIVNNRKISSLGNKIMVLSLLSAKGKDKNKGAVKNRHFRYDIYDYYLLNSAVEMIRKVKKNENILYHNKNAAARKILYKRVKFMYDQKKIKNCKINNFKVFEIAKLIRMAAKLIADGYDAKIIEKKGSWGEHRKQDNKNEIVKKKLKKPNLQDVKKQQKNEEDKKIRKNKKVMRIRGSNFNYKSSININKQPEGIDCFELKDNNHNGKSVLNIGSSGK
ncbi:MAG: hypothetical protein PVG30_00805 [Gammaproteobacteria bacterium]|jgi:hypothetical protein